MKKFVLIALVIALTACTPAPSKPTSAPVKQPTVQPATEAPTVTAEPDVPTETPPAATDVPTAAPAEPAAPAAANSFGNIEFSNRTSGNIITGKGEFSVAAIALKCDNVPNQVTFTLNIGNPDIYKVNYVYRLTAVDTPTISTGWSGDAKMQSLGNGKYEVIFSADQVPSKARTWKAWLDVQFVAFDSIDLTYFSPLFTKLITYTNQCP